MQITDLIRDSPLMDLGTVLSQYAHVIVPRDEEDDSFEYNPEEEVLIGGKDDDNYDQTDEDYKPEGDDRSGGSGESDREGEGVKRVRGCLVWLWIGRVIEKGRVKFRRKGRVIGRVINKGRVKFRRNGRVKFRRKGRVKFRKKGRVQGWVRE